MRRQDAGSTPPRSQSSTQHDERFSESQDSYDTVASNATSSSLPALVQSVSRSRTTSCTPSPKLPARQPLLSNKSQQHDLNPHARLPPSTPPKADRSNVRVLEDYSPSSASPSPRGVKRSANGVAKPQSIVFNATEPRGESLTSRQQHVREQARILQMRLQLAMTKVKHGWENMSMAEIDEMHSSQASPTFTGYAYPPTRLIASPYRHSRTLSALTAGSLRPTTSHSQHHHSRSHSVLASPAAVPFDLSRHTHSRGFTSLAPSPDLASISADYGSNKRLATPTPQEQDALDSLMLMGSPAGAVGGHFVRR